MSSFFTERGALPTLLALATFGLGACTEVQVEETKVELDTTSCSSGAGGSGNNNNRGNGQNGGNQQQPPQSTSAVMDTYIVQIFELNGVNTLTDQDCGACITARANCSFEKETCVCGDPTAVSADKLPGMLADVRMSIPAKYGSVYCMRVMAVQRTSQPEQCQCDSSWESPDRVRLCALSHPYAAGPLPVPMSVLCGDTPSFTNCAAQGSASTMTTTTPMN